MAQMNGKTKTDALGRRLASMLPLLLLAAFTLACVIMLPDAAYANEQGGASGGSVLFSFSSIFDGIRTMVNTIIIPLGILIAGWKIAYLALVCGVMGIDPLAMMPDNSTNWSYVWIRIKFHLTGFVKGLFWVGGVWTIFNVILYVVSAIADGLASSNLG